MQKIFDLLSSVSQKKLIKEKQPTAITPMLATLTDKYFDNPNWIYEHKWDGYRILAYKQNGKVTLLTRNQKDYTQNFINVAKELEQQKSDNFIIDGEVIAVEKKQSKFQYLQDVGLDGKKHVKLLYYVFDIIYFDKYNLTHLKLLDRKEILKSVIKDSESVKLTEYKIKNGLKYLDFACKHQWEGLIAKNGDSKYLNKRSKDWLKFKCHNQQELIIVGFTNPGGSRIGFGALLLGYYENKKLKYAGKVGTGFNFYLLEELGKILRSIEQDNPTIANTNEKYVHWVKPLIVGEVKFTEWTKDNKLRHPSFLGLRPDKEPKLIVKEVPK